MAEGALARRNWVGDAGPARPTRLPGVARPEPAGSGDQRPRLLIADDELPLLQMLERLGARLGFDVVTCDGGQAALRAMRERPADLALVDLRMPDLNGLEVLRQFKAEVPGCPVIIMTAYGAIDSAVEAMKLGAREYITKPFDFPQLRQLLGEVRDELGRQREHAEAPARPAATGPDLCRMLGDTPVIHKVSELVRSLASTTKVVFISGERGTGKELVARAFHQYSDRRDRPFVSINCAALVDSLFERELFGQEKAAAGSTASTPGLFEAAQGGTIFLDDVADLPLAVQGMLLQLLESGELTRVGAERPRAVDVAVVAATQRDLRADVASGRFRADLFYRLNVVGIVLPPLRERRDDIAGLAESFLQEAPGNLQRRLTGFSEDAMTQLRESRWDGNVRELRSCVERAASRASGPLVALDDLLVSDQGETAATPLRPSGLHVVRSGGAGRAPLQDVEKEHILSVLREVRGNRVAAAKVLGISRRALYRRLARHQIAAEGLHAVPHRPANDDSSGEA